MNPFASRKQMTGFRKGTDALSTRAAECSLQVHSCKRLHLRCQVFVVWVTMLRTPESQTTCECDKDWGVGYCTCAGLGGYAGYKQEEDTTAEL